MKLVRLVLISGNLTVTIPRELVRELGLCPRDYVSVARVTAEDRAAFIVERREHDRSARGRRSP